jgi:pimeloyl-ACP methyl ester carboxylesterase
MPLLRALALPGAEVVLPVVCRPVVRDSVERLTGLLGRVGLRPDPVVVEMWRSYTSLTEAESREAFVQTLRAVVDHRGQRVSAKDKLYLAQDVPTLIIWGDADPVIPVAHAHAAAEAMPGSTLELMSGCGHFPYVEQPRRFVGILSAFMAATEPASVTSADLSRRLAEHAGGAG